MVCRRASANTQHMEPAVRWVIRGLFGMLGCVLSLVTLVGGVFIKPEC